MTESEWLTATEPQKMLAFLRDKGTLSERKLRLFAVACCRRVWHLMADERSRKAVEVAERFADGFATLPELDNAAEPAWRAAKGPFDDTPRGQFGAYFHAAMAAWWTAGEGELWVVAGEVISRAIGATVCDPDDPELEDAAQTALLRDIVAPFLPSYLDASAWNNGLIKQLAEAAYEERALPSGHLDNERLAVLADALEEVGADVSLLEHLRSQGPHVRGCVAVDAVLGKA